MPSVQFYNTPSQRNALKQSANNIGESTIHDDFVDSNGNPTDGNSGRLTFDVIIPTPLTADQITVRALVDKINNNQSLNNVEERDFRRLYIIGEVR